MAASGVDAGQATLDETLAEPFFVSACGIGEANHGVEALAVHDAFASGVDFEWLMAEPIEGGFTGIVTELKDLRNG